MQTSKYQFALDLHDTQSQICLMATQGDTGREFVISFSDGGEPYSLKGVHTVQLFIQRPNMTVLEWGDENGGANPRLVVEEDGSVSQVIYKFTPDTCKEYGLHDCQLVFYGDDAKTEEIWSPCFSLFVNKKKRALMT